MTEPAQVRDFDFWVGSWEVFSPEGELIGTSRITPLYDGRVIAETWTGRSGVLGTSLNAWDDERGVWHQTWMDSTGSVLLLDGALHYGLMVLEGVTGGSTAGSNSPQRQRITWTPSADGQEVRQLWETSDDEGVSWSEAFDGRYRRVADPG
jgi:hypothetical protein